MKINWKLRLKNKTTLVAILSAIFLMLQQFGFAIPDNIQAGINTFVLILVLLGIINDPTTNGITDSDNAMSYNKPKKDGE